MNSIEKLFKIHQLHKLIKIGFTGNTNEYAKRLSISRSCFFNYKENLENAGAVIDYSRILNKYVYVNNFEFEININYSEVTECEMRKIKGGQSFFVKSIFLDR